MCNALSLFADSSPTHGRERVSKRTGFLQTLWKQAISKNSYSTDRQLYRSFSKIALTGEI